MSNKRHIRGYFHFLFSVYCNAIVARSGFSSSFFKYRDLISGRALPDLDKKVGEGGIQSDLRVLMISSWELAEGNLSLIFFEYFPELI